MYSAFATKSFLRFAGQHIQGIEFEGILDTFNDSFPYYIIAKKNNLFMKGASFIISPPCLSGSSRIIFKHELENGSLGNINVAGGFLQSRDTDLTTENGFGETANHYHYIDTRTNYRLDLGYSAEELLQRMKRDSRSRVKKIYKHIHLFDLIPLEHYSSSHIKIFSLLYSKTATRANFSTTYCFSEEKWHELFHSKWWSLYLLKYKNDYVAGAAVANLPGGYDYTFMGFEPCGADACRAIIILIYHYLSDRFSGFLDLGGGIIEDDGLSRFKNGLGAYKTKFKRLRFVKKSEINFSSEDTIKNNLNKRWP